MRNFFKDFFYILRLMACNLSGMGYGIFSDIFDFQNLFFCEFNDAYRQHIYFSYQVSINKTETRRFRFESMNIIQKQKLAGTDLNISMVVTKNDIFGM